MRRSRILAAEQDRINAETELLKLQTEIARKQQAALESKQQAAPTQDSYAQALRDLRGRYANFDQSLDEIVRIDRAMEDGSLGIAEHTEILYWAAQFASFSRIRKERDPKLDSALRQEFPELADQNSELFKRTRQILANFVDKGFMSSIYAAGPPMLYMAASQARAELKATIQ